MNKVLIITHAFPPGAGSGVLRALKFVKYLPGNDWLPVILTLKEKYNDKKDFSMVKEIPEGACVYRSSMINIIELLLIFRRKPKKKVKNSEKKKCLSCNISEITKHEKKKNKIVGFFVNLFTTPDRFIGWLIPGVSKGILAIMKEKVTLIYSTSPAKTTLLIGVLLKIITRIPLVVDFRDPWTLTYDVNKMSKIRMAVENWLEKLVFRNADKIIANTEHLKTDYLEKYSWLDERKIKVITNGYDHSDFVNIARKTPKLSKVFTISHVGEFYEQIRTPDNFLKAVGILLKEGKWRQGEVKINFVGGGEYVQNKKFIDLLHDLKLENIVNITKHLPHRESLQYMFDADVLLLLQPKRKTKAQIPAKAFEYMRTGNYILTLAPPGATADFIKGINNGVVVNPEAIDDIKVKINELYLKFRRKELKNKTEESKIGKYSREELTKELSIIFKEVTQK